MYIRRGFPLSVVAVDLPCRFLLSMFYIAGFHSRDQLPSFAAKRKKRTCIWIELATLRMSLGHQHACLFFAWGHQYGHPDVMIKPSRTASTATKSQICLLSYEKIIVVHVWHEHFHPIQGRRMTTFAFVCTM